MRDRLNGKVKIDLFLEYKVCRSAVLKSKKEMSTVYHSLSI